MTNYTIQYKHGEDVDLEYNDEKHTYMVEGKQVPAVTRIVDAVSPKNLTEWAAKSGADWWMSNYHRCIENEPDMVGEYNTYIYDGIRYAHKEISREAQNIGSDVHKWIELHIRSKMDDGHLFVEYPDDVKVPMENFHKWLAMAEKRGIEWLGSEKKIYSKLWNYAGTIDALARINGELYVIDFKTSAKIYKEYYLQVYGYAQAIHEMINDDSVSKGLAYKDYPKGMIVRLDKIEDKFQEVAFECEPRVFHYALSLKEFQSKRIQKLKI